MWEDYNEMVQAISDYEDMGNDPSVFNLSQGIYLEAIKSRCDEELQTINEYELDDSDEISDSIMSIKEKVNDLLAKFYFTLNRSSFKAPSNVEIYDEDGNKFNYDINNLKD